MSKSVITTERLGKAYRLGQKVDRNATFRDAIAGAVRSPLKRLKARVSDAGGDADAFWAIRDISFQVNRGEVVGHHRAERGGQVDAAEGAEPDHRADRGAGGCSAAGSASLLEVGTGFHPELTGRENIFLNGAILGMRQAEIVEVRRDRRLRRGEQVPRHAGQALQLGHVRRGWRSPSRPTWSRRS